MHAIARSSSTEPPYVSQEPSEISETFTPQAPRFLYLIAVEGTRSARGGGVPRRMKPSSRGGRIRTGGLRVPNAAL